ncbi:MAG TPA: hypothetical protein VKB75_17705 [Jatrophihabitans sp.]|nr:hypothetical protein [Jatrophihabitans sp.]
MRIRTLAVATAALAAVATSVGVASAATTKGFPATARIVVRPVTASGQVRAGFTVTGQPNQQVDCSFRDPSPAAVSPNIEFCSPSAEYAVACWKAALPHRVLCMRDPRTDHLVRIPRIGAFAPTPVAPAAQRAPLVMKLLDGDFCSIRSGGAGGSLLGHPNLFITYYCVHAGAVWAAMTPRHEGVNESRPSWTVQTARPGQHTLVTRHVVKAWFVGTA